ncbi:MAG: SUF system Fe-S cluster assembly regulator [Mariprofundus sp.]|nr:SUF system Fe-S cluster assembly regulator [Mariprofundus sp.]
MLRLTKLTDYGILLMTHMATSEQQLFTATELAEVTQIPMPTVSKILQMLLHENLLSSTRGARGGYQLTRDSTAINVRDVINVFEGAIALTECNIEGSSCDQRAVCSTSNNWKRINLAIGEALEGISLADMNQQDFVPVFRLQRSIAINGESIHS